MTSKKNLLLVDDSGLITGHLKKMLSGIDSIGMIETATALPEAQAIMKKQNTDIIVLDIKLPDGNGIDFLKWVKFIYPQTRVVMFSNLSDDVHRAAAMNAGADYFFDKSLEFEKIPVILESLASA